MDSSCKKLLCAGPCQSNRFPPGCLCHGLLKGGVGQVVGSFLQWPNGGHSTSLSVLEPGGQGPECRGSGSSGLHGISS